MPRVRRNQLIVPNTDSLNLLDTRTALLAGSMSKHKTKKLFSTQWSKKYCTVSFRQMLASDNLQFATNFIDNIYIDLMTFLARLCSWTQ